VRRTEIWTLPVYGSVLLKCNVYGVARGRSVALPSLSSPPANRVSSCSSVHERTTHERGTCTCGGTVDQRSSSARLGPQL
jgi:hypothetical protein